MPERVSPAHSSSLPSQATSCRSVPRRIDPNPTRALHFSLLRVQSGTRVLQTLRRKSVKVDLCPYGHRSGRGARARARPHQHTARAPQLNRSHLL